MAITKNKNYTLVEDTQPVEIKNTKLNEAKAKRDDAEQIPVVKNLNDFYTNDYYKTQDRLYVPITYLYTNGFDGYKKIRFNNNVIANGKSQFIKILIEREDI